VFQIYVSLWPTYCTHTHTHTHTHTLQTYSKTQRRERDTGDAPISKNRKCAGDELCLCQTQRGCGQASPVRALWAHYTFRTLFPRADNWTLCDLLLQSLTIIFLNIRYLLSGCHGAYSVIMQMTVWIYNVWGNKIKSNMHVCVFLHRFLWAALDYGSEEGSLPVVSACVCVCVHMSCEPACEVWELRSYWPDARGLNPVAPGGPERSHWCRMTPQQRAHSESSMFPLGWSVIRSTVTSSFM